MSLRGPTADGGLSGVLDRAILESPTVMRFAVLKAVTGGMTTKHISGNSTALLSVATL